MLGLWTNVRTCITVLHNRTAAPTLVPTLGFVPADGDANVPKAKRIDGCSRLDFRCNITTPLTVLVTLVVVCFIG